MGFGVFSSNSKDRYSFYSPFEELKAKEYMLRLLNSSRYLSSKSVKLFELSVEIFGVNRIISIMKKGYPDFVKSEAFADLVRYSMSTDKIPNTIVRMILRNDIKPLLLRKSNKKPDKKFIQRLNVIKSIFNLSSEEMEVIVYFYLVSSSELVKNIDEYVTKLTNMPILRNSGDILLGINKSSLLGVFERGILYRYELLKEKFSKEYELNTWLVSYLSGVGKDDLTTEFFTRSDAETLQIEDFESQAEELKILDTLLKDEEGKNILFYGKPGTGKTSFVKSLAKRYGKELFIVKIPENDVWSERARAIYATANLADRSKTIILVDEADDLLNTQDYLIFKPATATKAWINNLLDSHKQKMIWITNRTSEMDPSTLRRFAFSMEFKNFSTNNRMRILQYELKKKGLEEYFSEIEMMDLCINFSVNADGIINAINSLNITEQSDKDEAIRKIRTVLKNHEMITGNRSPWFGRKKGESTYSLSGLNTSYDLERIIVTLQKYVNIQGGNGIDENRSISLLLHGAPGTGKTAFVAHVSRLLKKEVVLKRASEIQSMWVGQTEKNIADAFREAQRNNQILFFDEADSFLYPRAQADHSWEKSFTNEILTQIESFTGIVIFATNDIDGLDHAVLRRCKFKIQFNPLTPEGNLHFYMLILKPLMGNNQNISEREIEDIMKIENLTPGDFAVVKDQFIYENQLDITHQKLVDALQNEVSHKKTFGKKIGFSRV